jgi:hypothetical protein
MVQYGFSISIRRLGALAGVSVAPLSRRTRSRARPFVFALAFMSVGSGINACGLGIYDDTGTAVPGLSWPWICQDGSTPVSDGGCTLDSDDGADTPFDGDDASDGSEGGR